VFRFFGYLGNFLFNPLSIGNHKVIFAEYFKGFDKVEAVKGIFGEKTDEILSHLKVELSWFMGYMYVTTTTGTLQLAKNI